MAQDEYIRFKSEYVKVYPSVKRDDNIDRNARLYSEQNIISAINRLADKDSFIIDGLNVDGHKLYQGSCNIHGYLFNIAFGTNITNLDIKDDLGIPDPTPGSILYLYLELSDTNIDNILYFKELNGFDMEESNQTYYDGLRLKVATEQSFNTDPSYKLALAKYGSDGKWHCNDSIYTANNHLKFDSNNIYASFNTSQGLHLNGEKSLQTFIDSFVIDDGELTT